MDPLTEVEPSALAPQPLPSIDATCGAFLTLASSRVTGLSAVSAVASDVEDLRTSQLAGEVQQWLSSHHRQPPTQSRGKEGNVYTQTFFSHLHLVNRDPLPFGENYSVLLQQLPRHAHSTAAAPAAAPAEFGASTITERAVEHAACVTRAALAFWAGLSLPREEERLQFLRCVEGTTGGGASVPLPECSQYFALFGSSRLPSVERDVQYFAPVFSHCHRSPSPPQPTSACVPPPSSSMSSGEMSFVVVRKGQFFAVTLPNTSHGALALPSLDELRATFLAIANHADARDGSVSERPTRLMGLLTCMQRDEAAAWRDRVLRRPESQRAVSAIQSALFLVCLDEVVLTPPPETESAVTADRVEEKHSDVRMEGIGWRRKLRTVFNYVPDPEQERGGCNRWFEKGIQIIVADVSKPGRRDDGDEQAEVIVGLNVEHSFADSGVVHKMCAYLWKEAQAAYSSKVAGQSATTLEWGHLAWGEIDEELVQQLRSVRAAMAEETGASANRTADCVIRGIGRQFFKDHNFSPDSCFQIAKYVWNLETLDARHFRDGRLMIADVFTAEFRQLQAAIFGLLGTNPDAVQEGGESGGARLRDELDACGRDEGLVALFEDAVRAHLRVLARHKEGMECYLHLFFLTNEMGLLTEHPPHRLCENETYCDMYRHHIVGSNLGNDVGIEFVFSGIPPQQSMDVLGYMLADDHIKLTLTSRSDIRPSFLPTFCTALSLVRRWVLLRAATSCTPAQ